MTIDLELDGKRALVTGAGQGVGEGIAHLLAAAGVHVLVNDLVAERAEAVAAAIVAGGGRAQAAPFDVTDHDGVHAVVAAAGPVDILVNNAGNAGGEGWPGSPPFLETGPADWARFIDVNLVGVMSCVHAALPGMIDAGWGRIVTIVSDAGRTGDANMAAYGAAKAGAAGFSRGIAHEVARHGITVNNVALGTMRTPLSEAFWADPDRSAQHKAMLGTYLVRRPGEPNDAAWAVISLVTPLASWVTGQTIPVNGGYSFAL
ncbi:SDR family NAD(P)-dependent oxidoreductase [Aquihabitans sp. McL0605]|uniref:SDR family NAD(P)-dependent oxidoreductase n=1 Tax=Aquihabitans sp. McL0605 TaxID=3415671 RepID=UPI003CEF6054